MFLKIRQSGSLMILLLLACFAMTVSAGNAKVMSVLSMEDRVKVYARGVSDPKGAFFQVGNIPGNAPSSCSVGEDAPPMRTLILLDNSLSVPKTLKPQVVKDAISGILSVHGENEQFRLALISEEISYLSDQYSSDYTALDNVVDVIEFRDQETMLTDVVYGVIEEMSAEGYEGYSRLILIADGVNDKPVGGMTLDRLIQRAKELPFPIYTIGVSTGKNEELLDNLFSLSWQTGADYLVLEQEEDIESIKSMTAADASMVVFEAEIPKAACTGGKNVESRIQLSGGEELVFPVDTPFSVIEEKPQEEKKEEPTVVIVSEPEPKPREEEPQGIPLWILIASAAGVLVLSGAAAALIIILLRKRKRGVQTDDTIRVMNPADDSTVLFGEKPGAGDANDTKKITPGANAGKRKAVLTLTDQADQSRFFRCELEETVHIGRGSENEIQISDDMYVHRKHCTVQKKGNSYFIEDVVTKKDHNPSYVNGSLLKQGIPQLIVTNSKVTIGEHNYIVKIEE